MAILSRAKKTGFSDDAILLTLEIPRANDKKELAAEQMLAALHGMLRSKKELKMGSTLQEHISLEIAAIDKRIRFYIWTPKHLQSFVEGQIYAQYPTVQIHELDAEHDYSKRNLDQKVALVSEIDLTDNETIPIKTFPSFEVDPLAAITGTLAKLGEGEEVWIQMMARPISDDWHKRGSKMVARIQAGGGMSGGKALGYIGQAIGALGKPPEESKSSSSDLSERDKTRIKSIEEKGTKLGYQTKIRIVYAGHDETTARLRLQAMVGTFKQFNTTNLNGFQQKYVSFDRTKVAEYAARFFIDKGFILNIEELASLFHLPHTSVETPNIVWATSKTAEPPATLPTKGKVPEEEVSLFGVTNFRGTNTVFGLGRGDRGRHMYIIGQTGTGKSGLLELLTLSDIYYNQGFAVIDPHGDYALNMLKFIPEHRKEDVVYFNPADTQFPIGFNPMEVTDPSLKNHISSELVGVLKRMFESWGPRLEYILRYTILALLDYPDSTMLDITRMLTERKFRDDVISHVYDPVVKNFWTVEFASWNDKFAAEAVAPVLNKVGAFVANPMIRNIVGQPKSTFNVREIMDNGKILIVNLSRGLVGEDNAAILGALMVTKIQLAAMSRANVALEERKPFYLYVDEFQNFATDSFAVILSEARKYGLNLTVANQYVSQMSQIVKDAVFGNVGSMVSFRVGADDAAFMSKYFMPQFEAQDILQLHNRYFVSTLQIGGEKTIPFSGSTLNVPASQTNYIDSIVEHSRSRYARSKSDIEDFIQKSSYSAQSAPKPTQKHDSPSHNESPRNIAKFAAKVVQGAISNEPAADQPHNPVLPVPAKDSTQTAPKKKRTRSRRKKSGSATNQTNYEQNKPAGNVQKSAPANDEFTIKLR